MNNRKIAPSWCNQILKSAKNRSKMANSFLKIGKYGNYGEIYMLKCTNSDAENWNTMIYFTKLH